MSANLKNKIISDIITGNSLLKYAYIGNDGVENFNAVINSEEYYGYDKEIGMIEVNSKKLSNIIKDRMVVLGVGNGQKIKQLAGIIENNKEIYLIDISKEFLEAASILIHGNVKVENCCFETMDMSKFGKNTTFVMYGGTLGNVEDYICFLIKIKQECPQSNIIIGMEFNSNTNGFKVDDKMLFAYKSEKAFEFVFNPLKKVGFNWEDGKMDLFFNKELGRIEKHFVFNEESYSKRQKIGLENINKALLALSYKPSRKIFFQRLIENKFNFGSFICHNGENSIFEIWW